MKVLITGFTPFGGEKVNPSYEIVKKIEIKGHEIIKLEVPTVFDKASKVVYESIKEHQPDIVIALGQAGMRTAISVERVAINIIDARISDNEGNQPIDEFIKEDGENAYFSNLPIKRMVDTIRNNGIPAYVSDSAGTYVCNYLFYNIMYYIHKEFPKIKGGFIHVPYEMNQVLTKNMPSMSLDVMTKAVEIGIQTAINNEMDIKIIGGSIC